MLLYGSDQPISSCAGARVCRSKRRADTVVSKRLALGVNHLDQAVRQPDQSVTRFEAKGRVTVFLTERAECLKSLS